MYEVKPWTLPESYFGATWDGYHSSGFGQHRDSDHLEQSNFACVWEALKDFEGVQIVRENHWAVGWVEWIAIPSTCEKALEVARNLCEQANDYPALDEMDWSDREWEDVCDTWEQASIRDRLEYLEGTRISIFAARRDTFPEDPQDALRDRLLGY